MIDDVIVGTSIAQAAQHGNLKAVAIAVVAGAHRVAVAYPGPGVEQLFHNRLAAAAVGYGAELFHQLFDGAAYIAQHGLMQGVEDAAPLQVGQAGYLVGFGEQLVRGRP